MRNLLELLRLRFEAQSFRRNCIMALMLGLMAALAMPPVGLWPLLFILFPLLWLQLQTLFTTKHVFILVWLFSFGYFTAGLYWIAAALFVDIANNWWVLPFAVMGLPALMSFYPAAAAAIWHRLAWQGPARVLSFIALVSLSEWVRGFMFTGFPWNLWGYAWMDLLPVMQSVAVWGIYGLTLMTLLAVFLPILWCQRTGIFAARAIVIGVLVVLAFSIIWGMGRIDQSYSSHEDQMRVRIVQPNIPQEAKWDADQRLMHEDKIWALTAQSAEHAPDMVVWPETAITLVSTEDVRRMEEKLHTYLPTSAVLAAGTLDVGWDSETRSPTFFNRIGFYRADGERLDAYDKFHLVPFGEYLPYQRYWPVKPVAFQSGRFTAGRGVQTISIGNIPSFSPLICYEVLFPSNVVRENQRPQWILNVTNDGWYGRTSGPYQHLAIARVRAIEEGLPLVRAANTGVSAVIDPLGRIARMLPLGTTGIIDSVLPPALQSTFYARHGQTPFLVMCIAILGFAGFWQRSKLKKLRHV
jgi:apolipoprotein N-acyltransferase